jgi:hypothetical protein
MVGSFPRSIQRNDLHQSPPALLYSSKILYPSLVRITEKIIIAVQRSEQGKVTPEETELPGCDTSSRLVPEEREDPALPGRRCRYSARALDRPAGGGGWSAPSG